jgi:hypothetical protein
MNLTPHGGGRYLIYLLTTTPVPCMIKESPFGDDIARPESPSSVETARNSGVSMHFSSEGTIGFSLSDQVFQATRGHLPH